MICDLARLQGKGSKNLKFPFAKDEEDLKKFVADHRKRLGPAVAKAILALKPFKGGNLGLRGLHDLDIDDKHETLLPYYVVAECAIPAAEEMLAAFGMQMNLSAPLTEGSTAMVLNDANPWDTIRPLQGPPVPMFPTGSPFPEAPVLEVLNGLAQMVADILDDFETLVGDGDLNTASEPT